MNTLFNPVEATWQVLEKEIRARVDRVFAHRKFIMGPEVTELEEKIAEQTTARHVITCASGTDALMLSLMALGVGPGQAIFTSAFSFVAAAEVTARLNATPIFIDIDPHTFTMDPGKLQAAIKKVTQDGKLTPRGIIPVDLFGVPADYDSINAIAKEHELFVVADAAHSLGATFHDRAVGTLSDITALSFFPSKPLGALGDGGAVITNNDALASTVRQMRIHGRDNPSLPHVRLGLNSRLDTIQAAVLLVRLEHFENDLARRRALAARYAEVIGKLAQAQAEPPGYRSAWAYYSVLTDVRDALRFALEKQNIPVAVYYPRPLPAEPVFASLGYTVGDFPVAQAVSRRILHLPMHSYLNDEAADSIGAAVTGAINFLRA